MRKFSLFIMIAVGGVLTASSLHAADADAPAAAAAAITAASSRPNIVFIFSDDHAYQAVSAYGGNLNETPNIDRLAKEGMLFRNCLVTNSLCGPCRAVVLTGKYSHLNKYYANAYNERFDGSQQTFPKLMQAAGYQTAIVGKWHLESDPTGFNYWHILPGQGQYYNPPMIEMGKRVKHEGYVTDIITDICLDWLQNKRDQSKPFVLMCQHKAPHRDWEPGPKYLTLYQGKTIPEPDSLFDDYSNRASGARDQHMEIAKQMRPGPDLKIDWSPPALNAEQKKAWDAAYAEENAAFHKANLTGKDLVRWKYQRYVKDYLRCIASVDENVGRVLKYLDDTGLAKNTIVIYSADQGFYVGEHGWFDKRWMYNESLHTPLLVRWPDHTKPGSSTEAFVSNLDFAETFLDAAGIKVPDDMQGRSIVPVLEGKTPADWRTAFYYHYYEAGGEHNVPHQYGITTATHKLIRYPQLNEWELFDLTKDPHEMKSVYSDPAYESTVQELKKQLAALQVQYKDENPERPIQEILKLERGGKK